MQTLTTIAAAVLSIGIAAPAFADSSRPPCSAAPKEQWLPSSAVARNLEDLGYRVERVKVKHGCFELTAVEETNQPIEVSYHPVSGVLVRAKLKD